MPVPYLNKLSKETGKSVNELEKLWSKAKKLASEHFGKPESEFSDKEFAYVVGVVKKMAGVKEAYDWHNAENKLKKQGLTFIKDYLIIGSSRFTLFGMYEKSGLTAMHFYCRDDGTGNEKSVILEYYEDADKINDRPGYINYPDEIYLFDSYAEAMNFIDKNYRDCAYLSIKNNRVNFISIVKTLFESYTERFIATEDVKIPGTDIVIKKGQSFEFCEDLENDKIEITEECCIPGTDIVLEAGDQIMVVKEGYDQYIVTLSGSMQVLNWYMRRLQMHIVVGLMNADYDMELDRHTNTLAVIFNKEKDAAQLVKIVSSEHKGATASMEKV